MGPRAGLACAWREIVMSGRQAPQTQLRKAAPRGRGAAMMASLRPRGLFRLADNSPPPGMVIS